MVNFNSSKWYKIKIICIVVPILTFGLFDFYLHGTKILNMLCIFGSVGLGGIFFILGKRHHKLVRCVKCNNEVKVGMSGNLPSFHRKGKCKQ